MKKTTGILLLFAAFSVMAEVRLPAVFSDNMVLQCGKDLAVWGRGTPGEQVSVSFGGVTRNAAVADSGLWKLTLPPFDASKEARDFTVSCTHNSITVKNVIVGDVWLLGGQSNMVMPVKNCAGGAELVKSASAQEIRFFTSPQRAAFEPDDMGSGEWLVFSPESALEFSGLGCFFAMELYRATGVPQGMICAARNGSSIQLWLSLEAMKGIPELSGATDSVARERAEYPERNAAAKKRYSDYLERFKEWRMLHEENNRKLLSDHAEAVKAAAARGEKAPNPPAIVGPPIEPDKEYSVGDYTPTSRFNAMTNPLIPFGLRGMVFYQGESNSSTPLLYRKMFPALITDLRGKFGQGDLPFIYVQLANYTDRSKTPTPFVDWEDNSWAYLRESQDEALKLPATAAALAIDIGDNRDIHPADKLTLARRAAAAALGMAHGRDVPYIGPTPEKIEFRDGKAVVAYRGVAADPLTLCEDVPAVNPGKALPLEISGRVFGFDIAGKDRKYFRAEARIVDGKVEVSSPKVPEPCYLRYAFENNPRVNLYSRSGFPAVPFRSDSDLPKDIK